ncbi:phosphoribosylanthranilate isomerase [Egbenema bharatensis]|uniref:phosphoribosylanthranilate isomerase n=1 Tax=Egbenema bharatensis TaxID=3463334 RepID=UPI003A8A1E69
MRVKICGITRGAQGRSIAQLGASALGFICVERSPRYVRPEQIREIVDGLLAEGYGCDRVGVFADAEMAEICRVVEMGLLNAVQLHGSESPEFCQQLRSMLPTVEMIKAFRVRSAETLESVRQYEGLVDTLLLDAYDPNLLGGTGHTIDWSLLQGFRSDCAWLLAGGLTPENIGDALERFSPDGIDLSSGVEVAPGNKDLRKVEQLFEVLRRFHGAVAADAVG